ncbi:hypothetical protein DPMN_046097 [Dreissena polymorpha]|uniref:Secreted protein n=1 Tax=Dreissena polymorpha TaxID=45954 RepID=A0A9D4D793_DREPO|nr:hypothetical protein DPMN_046097 [Dreissena polymorpha]
MLMVMMMLVVVVVMAKMKKKTNMMTTMAVTMMIMIVVVVVVIDDDDDEEEEEEEDFPLAFVIFVELFAVIFNLAGSAKNGSIKNIDKGFSKRRERPSERENGMAMRCATSLTPPSIAFSSTHFSTGKCWSH